VVAIKPRGDVMIHATRRRARYNSDMRNEFTAIVERDGPWFIAYCAEVPGANGQGTTHEDCLANLREPPGAQDLSKVIDSRAIRLE
jgi:hypothetical protein